MRTTLVMFAMLWLGCNPSTDGSGNNLGGTDGGSGDGGARLSWYQTCGDPVCGQHRPPPQGTGPCTTEKEGAACSTAGAQCDPGNACNSYLRCADKDPRTQPGGCPISRRRFKQDIAYLTPAQQQALYEELLRVRLATYRYRDGGPAAPRRLGFLIEDQEQSLSVDRERDLVDLYGYTSMAVGALQVQAQEIQALKAEVERLRAQAARRGRR